MTEQMRPATPTGDPTASATPMPVASPVGAVAPAYGAVPMAYGGPAPVLGRVRSTGVCMLLAVVTLGIYTLVWFFKTHDEMKRHTGHGLGGGLALLLAFVVGIVMPYVTSSEVGSLYERVGMRKPVSGATGLWYFPGCFC